MYKIQITVLFVMMFSFVASAQDYSKSLQEDEILVEVRQDLTKPYKERRESFGGLFSFNMEKFYPEEHVSAIQNKAFDVLTDGESISLFGGEIGVKYNFSLGSLTGIVGYATGTISNEAQNLNEISLNILKLGANFALDNLFSEPWVVPYAQAGVHQINWTEESVVGSDILAEDLQTTPNIHFKLGALFQLNWIENWIDPNTTTEGLRSSGLENTFVDVFYTQYTAYAESEDSGDSVDLSSGGLGVGLKLEF